MIDLEAVKEIYKLEDLIKVVIETDCLDTPEVHNYETDHDIIKQSEVSDAWAALRLKDKIKPLLDSLMSQLAEANKEIERLRKVLKIADRILPEVHDEHCANLADYRCECTCEVKLLNDALKELDCASTPKEGR